MSDIHKLAREMADVFEGRTRENGEDFRCLKDDAPGWMTDVVRAAHGDMMPDDWRYNAIEDACVAIADADDMDDAAHEFADAVDVYNGALLRWVSSHLSRAYYVDDAVSEYDYPDDFFTALQRGQYQERMEVFNEVRAALARVVHLRGESRHVEDA